MVHLIFYRMWMSKEVALADFGEFHRGEWFVAQCHAFAKFICLI